MHNYYCSRVQALTRFYSAQRMRGEIARPTERKKKMCLVMSRASAGAVLWRDLFCLFVLG